jgi:hypothetical protein
MAVPLSGHQEGGMTMGHPSQEGGKIQAASAAEHAGKSFPTGTDTAQVAAAQSAAMGADSSWRDQCASGPHMTGSPVTPEIRQVRVPADMGEGYREAAGDTPR